jgi:subtilase family serine protease
VRVENIAFELWTGDGNERIGTTVVAALDPGASEEVSFVWSDKEVGVHPLKAVIDPHDRVTESNEQNNELAGSVLVPVRCIFLPVTVADGQWGHQGYH